MYDMYALNGGTCEAGNECTLPTFDHAEQPPGTAHVMSAGEFAEFKARVCLATRGYRVVSKGVTLSLIPATLILVILPAVMYSAPVSQFLVFVLFGGYFYAVSRLKANNLHVDAEVMQICAEFTARLGGRAGVTFVTQHTGQCKPKHARIVREIWMGASVRTPHAGLPVVSGAVPATVVGHPTMGPPPHQAIPMPASGQPSGYSYPPVAPARQAGMPAYPAVPAYPAPPSYVPANQPEVFMATVPDGVEGGQTFEARTPSGRTVTVTAPAGSRGGLAFQTSG